MSGPLEQTRPESIPFKRIPIRGYTISPNQVSSILERLQRAANEQGQRYVNAFSKPDDVNVEKWEADKKLHVDQAWRVTTTVTGENDASIFAPTVDQVFTASTPARVANVYATNSTAFQSLMGRDPPQLFELQLDFTSPPILDGDNPTTAPTPNGSSLFVRGGSDTWVASVENAVFEVLENHKNRRNILHLAFVYEFFLIVFGLPLAFFAVYLVHQGFSDQMVGIHPVLSGGIYVYVVVITLFIFRQIFGYLKFLYPIVELDGEYNRPKVHRKWVYWIVGIVFAGGLTKLLFG